MANEANGRHYFCSCVLFYLHLYWYHVAPTAVGVYGQASVARRKSLRNSNNYTRATGGRSLSAEDDILDTKEQRASSETKPSTTHN